ncbi:MAG: GAF domain-containing protein [Acidobacteriaceae bacterium]
MSGLPELVSEIDRAAATAPTLIELQQSIVDLIGNNLDYYSWVGFYMLDPEDRSVLVLGPFRGAPTPHVRIPVTEGICGAAVVRGETVIVGDVLSDPRYLSCSIETQSEIVTPIRVNGRVVGEIDVDSHSPNAFQVADREFLEKCAATVGRYMQSQTNLKAIYFPRHSKTVVT